jgi:hypothetical protein
MVREERLMIELTEQQEQVLDASPSPPKVLAPHTNRTYVLVPSEVYERLEDLLDPGSLTVEERRTILQGVWKRANWDDPRMDDYDTLEPKTES